eukprot:9453130-Lingulodinium_polyedra.AAC.1
MDGGSVCWAVFAARRSFGFSTTGTQTVAFQSKDEDSEENADVESLTTYDGLDFARAGITMNDILA